ncbi:unnamed protein product [Effrenium voratum]|uniref:Uncharacterized protein n=1 Tax=Effrenium voratum TaxID=2562239 RepID=A0AA36JLR1_9DINO|nr:unnamed protein product [Effrenium voratum]
MDGTPEILETRFGLEQRCSFRHPDLYDEEVPEVDLETVIAFPELGAECGLCSFLLLGDQNAGKSTMLHSFCRSGDLGFMQLCSLLPILASSFVNTRMVPDRLLDPNAPLSAVRDELPYMDTDIARGLVMLSLESFGFFCQEFGLWTGEELPSFLSFGPEVRFVALHFTELGGDHLDRLLQFQEEAPAESAQEAFWAQMHEVMLGSLRLLKETNRTVFFINCATLFPGGALSAAALRQTLRKLKFLDGAAPGVELLFYCARLSEVPMDATGFERRAGESWREAHAVAQSFAECGAAVTIPDLPLLHWQHEDLAPALAEVAPEEVQELRAEERAAGPLLAWLHNFFAAVLPALCPNLRLVAVAPVRNYRGASAGERVLCAASVARNVAMLLRRAERGRGQAAVATVAEEVLRCARRMRHFEGETLHGCWVTPGDLARHLEECEAEQLPVALPEVSVAALWGKAAELLLGLGLCTELAGGSLPKVVLELVGPGTTCRLWAEPPAEAPAEADPSQPLFITRGSKRAAGDSRSSGAAALCAAWDAELFELGTSAAALQTLAAESFGFRSPEALARLGAIRARLRQSLRRWLGAREVGPLLRCAADLWQAERLAEADESEREAKRPCLSWPEVPVPQLAAELRAKAGGGDSSGESRVRVEEGPAVSSAQNSWPCVRVHLTG